jgi:hypothetical protein
MEIEISKLLKHQFNGEDFERVDLFLKVCVLTSGDLGRKAYEEMYGGLFPNRKKKIIEARLKEFEELSNLYDIGKFDLIEYPIVLTRGWKVWDGAHRLSIAIANEEKTVNIDRNKKISFRVKPNHTISRYKKFLSGDSLLELERCMNEILTRYEVNI